MADRPERGPAERQEPERQGVSENDGRSKQAEIRRKGERKPQEYRDYRNNSFWLHSPPMPTPEKWRSAILRPACPALRLSCRLLPRRTEARQRAPSSVCGKPATTPATQDAMPAGCPLRSFQTRTNMDSGWRWRVLPKRLHETQAIPRPQGSQEPGQRPHALDHRPHAPRREKSMHRTAEGPHSNSIHGRLDADERQDLHAQGTAEESPSPGTHLETPPGDDSPTASWQAPWQATWRIRPITARIQPQGAKGRRSSPTVGAAGTSWLTRTRRMATRRRGTCCRSATTAGRHGGRIGLASRPIRNRREEALRQACPFPKGNPPVSAEACATPSGLMGETAPACPSTRQRRPSAEKGAIPEAQGRLDWMERHESRKTAK